MRGHLFSVLVVDIASALFACGCGSTWNLPFSSGTEPSSFLPGGDGGRPGQSSYDASGARASGAGTGGGIPVFAHYVTWHAKVDGKNSIADSGTVVPCRSDLNPVGLPCPGAGKPADPALIGYDSLDPAIIEAQNADFEANGIVPLTSWWGPAGSVSERSGDLFLDAYFGVPSSVQTTILYEVTGLLEKDADGTFPFDGTPRGRENHRRFVAHMNHLNDKYFSAYPERFYDIDGKPVVFIWLSALFRGDFASAAKEAKATVPIYLVGSEVNVFNPPRPGSPEHQAATNRMRGLDAISSYGTYFPDLTRRYGGHLNARYSAEYVTGMSRWAAWARDYAPHIKVIVPVMFALDAHLVPGSNDPVLTSTPDEARVFAGAVKSLLESSAKRCGNFFWGALLVSWNEHYEGTSIEPTYEHGSSYLDVVRETFARAGPAPGGCRP